MAIKVRGTREAGATTALLIKNEIDLGRQLLEVVKGSKYFRELKINFQVADTIRKCNQILGMGGSSKQGCLYCEESLFNLKKDSAKIFCDHAVPVSYLTKQYLEHKEPIERLIFSPIARISEISNQKLTKMGLAKKFGSPGFPFARYGAAGIRVITHMGDTVDPQTWTDEDHWKLVYATSELRPVLEALELWSEGNKHHHLEQNDEIAHSE